MRERRATQHQPSLAATPRALRAGALFPSGVIAAMSAAMLAFLVSNVLLGGNPPAKKSAKAA